MNKITFVLGWVATVTSLWGFNIEVTPNSLADWNVAGADKANIAQSEVLRLPEGTQLSRHFDADRVEVKLKTSLIFGKEVDDIPTVEAGPVAIAFVQDGATGVLMLVLGDTPAIKVPSVIKISEDGLGLIDLELGYDRSTGKVSITNLGSTQTYETDKTTGPTEVVISSGAREALVLSRLTVETPSAQGSGNGDTFKGDQGPSSDANAPATAIGKRKVGALLTDGIGSDPNGRRNEPPAIGKTDNTLFEVYTPPSLSRGRTNAVRVAAVTARKSQGKDGQ